jgi:ABC-type transport system involved in multi-copper enzyme maturation permease subunit
LRPIIAIASTTVGEAIRRRVLLVILLIGVLFLVIAPGLGILSARSETTVLRGLMLGVIQGVSALIAVILTVYMIPNEIERRTIYTILSKPVQRWQFLIGKYLGAVFSLLLMMAMMSAVMAFVFFLQQSSKNVGEIADLMKGPMMYFVQMCLLAAVGIFFSTFLAPLVNFFMTIGFFLVGTFFNPLFQSLQENQKTAPGVKLIAKGINTFLPNFADYNIQNPIINPTSVIQNEGFYYLKLTVYGVVYISILLIVGILIFDRREV